MDLREGTLPGLLRIRGKVHADERGSFIEFWRESAFFPQGTRFLQDNVSRSVRGVLRGLHFQAGAHAQGKLVTVLAGSIFDVAVDLRPESPAFRRWEAATLSGCDGQALYLPPGLAHGFLVSSAEAVVLYKCTAEYEPAAERGIRWDDPELGIAWPFRPELVSARDAALPSLRDWLATEREGEGA